MGPRRYDWAVTRTNCPEPERYARWLLVRWSASDPTGVAFFACGGPPDTTLAELVAVAGRRWAIQECFELVRDDCGLNEYEVRSGTGRHRHVTLSMFALAVVAVIRSRVPAPRRKGGEQLIRLSVPGVPHLGLRQGLLVSPRRPVSLGLLIRGGVLVADPA